MPDNKKKVKYIDGVKALRMPDKIYADFESLLLKQQSCQNNPDKSYTEWIAIHEPSSYSLDLVTSYDEKENKHSFYRSKDCIKKFCAEIKDIATKIVNRKKKIWFH